MNFPELMRIGFCGAGGDPQYSSVVLLMHGDGTNGGTTITDVKGHTVTRTGATTSTTQSKFGGSSIVFNGTSDTLTLAASADWSFTGDVTFEFWTYANTTTGNQDILGNYVSNVATDWIIQQNSGFIDWYPAGSGSFAHSAAFTANAWHHVACVRSGTACTVYIDGTGSTPLTKAGTLGDASKLIRISSRGGASGWYGGYLDEIRISNYARYTANFTSPTVAFKDF